MKSFPYKIVIQWSEEDYSFLFSVPELANVIMPLERSRTRCAWRKQFRFQTIVES